MTLTHAMANGLGLDSTSSRQAQDQVVLKRGELQWSRITTFDAPDTEVEIPTCDGRVKQNPIGPRRESE